MKKRTYLAIVMVLAAVTLVQAQTKFSAGVVVTRFENIGDDSRMSQISNPIGFGVVGGYSFSDELTAALTLEYFRGDIEGIAGKENDYRAHVSAYYHPISFAGFRPYISGGFVVSHKSFSFDFATTLEAEKTNMYGRFGCGIDYSIIPKLSANVDLGFYNDGSKIAGWSSSLGLRVAL